MSSPEQESQQESKQEVHQHILLATRNLAYLQRKFELGLGGETTRADIKEAEQLLEKHTKTAIDNRYGRPSFSALNAARRHGRTEAKEARGKTIVGFSPSR